MFWERLLLMLVILFKVLVFSMLVRVVECSVSSWKRC